ncbi:MAG: molybdenum-dependent transcriptional regulator [Hydrogenothermaceae bacterium]
MEKKIITEIYLNVDDKGYLGKGRVELLKLIDKYGSILKAAKELGMSYKAAWDMVDAINNLSPKPVVVSLKSGGRGGKTFLTDYGKKLVENYEKIEYFMREFSKHISENIDNVDEFLNNFRRMNMALSARNKILGKVVSVKIGTVSIEVEVEAGGNRFIALITENAVRELELKPGDEVYIIFKASNVLLSTENGMKLSARNKIKGEVIEVIEGAVNAEVKIKAGDNVITAIVTREAVKELGIDVNSEVTAIIKATDIIIGKI